MSTPESDHRPTGLRVLVHAIACVHAPSDLACVHGPLDPRRRGPRVHCLHMATVHVPCHRTSCPGPRHATSACIHTIAARSPPLRAKAQAPRASPHRTSCPRLRPSTQAPARLQNKSNTKAKQKQQHRSKTKATTQKQNKSQTKATTQKQNNTPRHFAVSSDNYLYTYVPTYVYLRPIHVWLRPRVPRRSTVSACSRPFSCPRFFHKPDMEKSHRAVATTSCPSPRHSNRGTSQAFFVFE